MIELISRPTLSSLRQYTDLPDLLEEYSSTIGPGASLIYLSPIYYTKSLFLLFLQNLANPHIISNKILFNTGIYTSLFGIGAVAFTLTPATGSGTHVNLNPTVTSSVPVSRVKGGGGNGGTHSLTHSLTQLLTHSLTHSLT